MRFSNTLLMFLGSVALVSSTIIDFSKANTKNEESLKPLAQEGGVLPKKVPVTERLGKETCDEIAKDFGQPIIPHGLKVKCQGQNVQMSRGKVILLSSEKEGKERDFATACRKLKECSKILGIDVDIVEP
ncbi:hypothetical protein K7432_006591 [Basidiobolus ranarum]|uniref:Uncharacterized protein n=1 Tax=Basidiobolus ranarum TaxID=34480 RepID=A0ABR2WUP4_9FUNG